MERKFKDVAKWTRKDFESLPRPKSSYNQEIGEVDSLVILPTRTKHDSGFRCMEFAVVQHGIPTYIVSGCSDAIHLGGIGGYNVGGVNCSKEELTKRLHRDATPRVAWSIDCLPVSGLLRIFCDRKIYIGASLSSFEIYFKED